MLGGFTVQRTLGCILTATTAYTAKNYMAADLNVTTLKPVARQFSAVYAVVPDIKVHNPG